MKLIRLIPLAVMFFLSFIGCSEKYVNHDELLNQVDVFGIELFSAVDYKVINGVVSSEEPCLKGYERIFDSINIIIGYGFNGKIRKITTLNADTSLFGIKPGMQFKDGKQKILQSGFAELTPPYKFKTSRYLLTLLVDGKDKIFGIILEVLD